MSILLQSAYFSGQTFSESSHCHHHPQIGDRSLFLYWKKSGCVALNGNTYTWGLGENLLIGRSMSVFPCQLIPESRHFVIITSVDMNISMNFTCQRVINFKIHRLFLTSFPISWGFALQRWKCLLLIIWDYTFIMFLHNLVAIKAF